MTVCVVDAAGERPALLCPQNGADETYEKERNPELRLPLALNESRRSRQHAYRPNDRSIPKRTKPTERVFHGVGVRVCADLTLARSDCCSNPNSNSILTYQRLIPDVRLGHTPTRHLPWSA